MKQKFLRVEEKFRLVETLFRRVELKLPRVGEIVWHVVKMVLPAGEIGDFFPDLAPPAGEIVFRDHSCRLRFPAAFLSKAD
jgi:hypothetical protein